MPIYRDWKNAGDYAFTKKLYLTRWAWEFLRRNKEYQRDWLFELKRYFKGPRVKEDIDFWQRVEGRDLIRDRTLWIENPRFHINTQSTKYADKYGVLYLVNPKNDKPFPNPFHSTRSLTPSGATIGDSRTFHKRYDKFQYPCIVFDLLLPIKPQIESVERNLNRFQKYLQKGSNNAKIKTRRLVKDCEKWTDYLRIIDAINDPKKPSKKEIAAVLYPDDDNSYPIYSATDKVKKSAQKAIEIVQSGFKEIASAGLAEGGKDNNHFHFHKGNVTPPFVIPYKKL